MTYFEETFVCTKLTTRNFICIKGRKSGRGVRASYQTMFSLRFRPNGRFWSQGSDTCRQAVRERNIVFPRPYEAGSFDPRALICSKK